MTQPAKRLLPIAGDGIKFILPPLFIAVACFCLQLWILPSVFLPLGVFFLLLSLSIVYFFRDPMRQPPPVEGAILSSGDGKVTAIEEVDYPDFPGGRAKKTSIFLSVLNVHINRSPIKSEVGAIAYTPGKFLNAMNDKSSLDNENNLVQFIGKDYQVDVRQIAGMIARRIVSQCQTGQQLEQGERFGLIRFGSRVDTYMPTEAEIKVRLGMKVKGGESILAVLEHSAKSSE